MGLLIDDLLAFSRLGRKPLASRSVDMGELARGVLSELKAHDGGIPAQVEIGPLPAADGDPALLRQVWANLISNAIKYSGPRGDGARVLVTGEHRGDLLHYSVLDNGVGFDMRYADKLFGVFQRLHSQDEFEGTGVGLAIVQRDRAAPRRRGSAQADPAGAPASASSCRPAEVGHMNHSRACRSCSWKTRRDAMPTGAAPEAPQRRQRHAWVRDGVEALEYLFCEGAYAGRDSGRRKLVLLDMKMPRMDGLQVLAKLKGTSARRPSRW
jgi:CheY-like chemotaxis protein